MVPPFVIIIIALTLYVSLDCLRNSGLLWAVPTNTGTFLPFYLTTPVHGKSTS